MAKLLSTGGLLLLLPFADAVRGHRALEGSGALRGGQVLESGTAAGAHGCSEPATLHEEECAKRKTTKWGGKCIFCKLDVEAAAKLAKELGEEPFDSESSSGGFRDDRYVLNKCVSKRKHCIQDDFIAYDLGHDKFVHDEERIADYRIPDRPAIKHDKFVHDEERTDRHLGWSDLSYTGPPPQAD